eukprot:TRINITY_DN14327_c0_g1_i1.p1 TRINITY_DN14327_c0_g1~~TRINITY_DN14327_c0_g1_i1.p1  ORF type:complete len:410 (+),score=61.71 TRINITY_DN14327_c0_g1_i1:113-1342(+)
MLGHQPPFLCMAHQQRFGSPRSQTTGMRIPSSAAISFARQLTLVLLVLSVCDAKNEEITLLPNAPNQSPLNRLVDFYIPFNNRRQLVRYQSLYTAADLTLSGMKADYVIDTISVKVARGATSGSDAAVINNLRWAYQWLDPATAASYKQLRPSFSSFTFKYVLPTVIYGPKPLSTATLKAGSLIKFDVANITWDGKSNLLLEFSMDNDQTKILSSALANTKVPSNTGSGNVHAYIYYDECWQSQSYPWSQLSSCSSKGSTYDKQSMHADDELAVLDVTFNEGVVKPTTPANPPTTSAASTTSSKTIASTTPGTNTASSTDSPVPTTAGPTAMKSTSSTPPSSTSAGKTAKPSSQKSVTKTVTPLWLILFAVVGWLLAVALAVVLWQTRRTSEAGDLTPLYETNDMTSTA